MSPPPKKIERRNLTGLDSKNDRAALLLTIAVGLVFGLVAGYVIHALDRGADGGWPFGDWVESSFIPSPRQGLRHDGLFWCLGGGAIAAALFYIRVLTRPQQ